MRRRWWSVLVVAIVAVGMSSATASAGTGGGAVTSYLGGAFVGSGGQSGSEHVFGDVRVWAPAGVLAFGNGEFFVRGYDCVTEDTVRARVDRLRSATAHGRLTLDCWLHDAPGYGDARPEHVTGVAVVELHWTGTGPVTHRTLLDPDCTYRFADRHADVTGSVVVRLPAIGFRATATPLDDVSDHLTRERSWCR